MSFKLCQFIKPLNWTLEGSFEKRSKFKPTKDSRKKSPLQWTWDSPNSMYTLKIVSMFQSINKQYWGDRIWQFVTPVQMDLNHLISYIVTSARLRGSDSLLSIENAGISQQQQRNFIAVERTLHIRKTYDSSIQLNTDIRPMPSLTIKSHCNNPWLISTSVTLE